MKKYSAPPPAADSFQLNDSVPAAKLEFPIAPDFISVPAQLDSQVMLRRIAEAMPWRSTGPGEEARRLAEKIPEEFVL